MWFMTYDYEYEKHPDHYKEKLKPGEKGNMDQKFLMQDFSLYSIGINRECFSVKHLFRYILYGITHSFCIYNICYWALNFHSVCQSDGKEIGLWVGGMTVYGVCIFVANFLLGLHAKTYEKFGVFLLFLGPFAYFFFYYILNVVFKGDIGSLFFPNYSIR